MEKIRINKYISDAGFCSRREADQLVADERVTVNGVLAVIGTKVSFEDKVRVDGEILKSSKQPSEKIKKVKAEKAVRKSSDAEDDSPKQASRIHRGARGKMRNKPSFRSDRKDSDKSDKSDKKEQPRFKSSGKAPNENKKPGRSEKR